MLRQDLGPAGPDARAGEDAERGGPGRSRGRRRTHDGLPYLLAGQLHPACLENKTALPFRFQVSKSEAARDGKNLGESRGEDLFLASFPRRWTSPPVSEMARGMWPPESGPLIGGESGRLAFPLRGLSLEAQEEALVSSTACGVQLGLGAPRNSSHTPAPASGACVVSLSCKRNENPWSRSPSLPQPFLGKKPPTRATAS